MLYKRSTGGRVVLKSLVGIVVVWLCIAWRATGVQRERTNTNITKIEVTDRRAGELVKRSKRRRECSKNGVVLQLEFPTSLKHPVKFTVSRVVPAVRTACQKHNFACFVKPADDTESDETVAVIALVEGSLKGLTTEPKKCASHYPVEELQWANEEETGSEPSVQLNSNVCGTCVANRFLFLADRKHAPPWFPQILDSFQQQGLNLTFVQPPKTSQHLKSLIEDVSHAAGVIGMYSSDYMNLLAFLPHNSLAIALSERGMSYRDGSWLQGLAIRNSILFINTRNYEDSVQKTSVEKYMRGEQFKFAKDELVKLTTEALILLRMIGKPQGLSPLPAPVLLEQSTPAHTTLDWYLPRTKYDPDHLQLGPVSFREGVLTLHNTSTLIEANGGTLRTGGVLTQIYNKASREMGNFSFGYYKENDKHYYPAVKVRHATEALHLERDCATVFPGTVYVHYPWVRDNIYHSHNDNFWPLFATFLSTGGTPEPSNRTLLLLKTKRSNKPVSAYSDILDRLVHRWGFMEDIAKEGETVCFEKMVWGRPRRLFSTRWEDVKMYTELRVLERWRAMVYAWTKVGGVVQSATEGGMLKVTWLDRKTPKRVLTNSKKLLEALETFEGTFSFNNSTRTVALSVQKCCDNLTFEQQVRLMAGTNILVGTHGAGLLHIAYLRPASVVAHLMPPRMNYHEQLIIERMAHASNVFYLNTHLNTPPDKRGEWNCDYYTIPEKDFPVIVKHAAALYVARNWR